jgi:hypothetical protein
MFDSEGITKDHLLWDGYLAISRMVFFFTLTVDVPILPFTSKNNFVLAADSSS